MIYVKSNLPATTKNQIYDKSFFNFLKNETTQLSVPKAIHQFVVKTIIYKNGLRVIKK
jgi:hypothetical protein